MAMFFFVPTVLLELIYIGLFLMTIHRAQPGGFRFWPPPAARSWQFFTAWIMASLVAVIFFLLGLLNFDRFFLPPFWTRLPVAMALFITGTVIGSWAFLAFDLRTTIGLGERLIIRGPYHYSRNPQYIGDSLNILGFVVLTNSWMVAVVGLLGIFLNYLAPFTEEPWLAERFGEAYLEYKARVPRFIGRRIIKGTL